MLLLFSGCLINFFFPPFMVLFSSHLGQKVYKSVKRKKRELFSCPFLSTLINLTDSYTWVLTPSLFITASNYLMPPLTFFNSWRAGEHFCGKLCLRIFHSIAVGRFILQCKQMNIVGTFIRVVYDLVPWKSWRIMSFLSFYFLHPPSTNLTVNSDGCSSTVCLLLLKWSTLKKKIVKRWEKDCNLNLYTQRKWGSIHLRDDEDTFHPKL